MIRRIIQILFVAAGGALALGSPVHAQASDIDPRIERILASISEERLGQLVQTLQGFETRHTMSSTDSPTRGIGAARQWILEEMQRSSPRLEVSFDSYRIPAQGRIPREVELRNVMAVLPGGSDRRIYIGGHYDSFAWGANRQSSWEADLDRFAPGANDDGSGTALTMELARVFAESGLEFDATLVFIAFAGEEEGLIGARLHAQRAAAEDIRIDAIYNNDTVGNITGGSGVVDGASVRVFSEGPMDSPSRQIARFIRRQAARYIPGHRVRLIAREDRFGRGGDHTAFNQHGYPGVRFTESKENYARQHTVEDTYEGVSPVYLAKNARVNAAAVATMALAPPAPVVDDGEGEPMLGRGESGYDAHLRWNASPGAASYRVFWREAWTPNWQHELEVGNVTEFVLPNVSIDDYVFGVAAVGTGGHESVVSAYVRLPRSRTEVETIGR